MPAGIPVGLEFERQKASQEPTADLLSEDIRVPFPVIRLQSDPRGPDDPDDEAEGMGLVGVSAQDLIRPSPHRDGFGIGGPAVGVVVIQAEKPAQVE